MLFRALYCALFALVAWSGTPARAQPTLVLGTSAAPPYHHANGTGFYDQLAGEAFRRAGLKLEIILVPAERGLRNANAGIDDGDLSRIAGLERLYSNLRRIPESILIQDYVAFSRTADIRTDRWNRVNPYVVARIRGWKIFENDFYQPVALAEVENPLQMFTMLELGRVDIVLHERWMGIVLSHQLGMSDVRVLEPPLARRKMFIYLHKKHEALIPGIADALREMKADGTYQRLFDQLVATRTR